MTFLRWLTLWPQNAALILGIGYLALAWMVRLEYRRAKAAGEEWE